MEYEYYTTCGRCLVTFAGRQENSHQIDLSYQAHEQLVHNYMTGQEFYDRFLRLFNPIDTNCAEFYMHDDPSHDGCDPIEHARRSGRWEVEQEAKEAAEKAANL